MVVITVIIAAILAVFAFGIGAPQKAPNTQLKFVATGGSVQTFAITNGGGDSLTLKDEKLIVKDWAAGTTIATIDGAILSSATFGSTSYLTPGNTITTGALAAGTLVTGNVLKVQVLDVPTGQMVSDSKVTVQ
jgi:FlaG/FlaF family flagellin (archaellin)